jgi:hypothetical protein
VNFIWFLDVPTTFPNIIQTPNGPINEGNKVTLTCVIEGGNPLAAITWSCAGATQITPTGSPSPSEATSIVELVTSKDNNILRFPPPIKLTTIYNLNIVEVALNTIAITVLLSTLGLSLPGYLSTSNLHS